MYLLCMEINSGVSPTYNGHTADELSDLTGFDPELLAVKLENPRLFTIAETAELAPHLGTTAARYVEAVLA